MPSHKENFQIWFCNIIESLYTNEHAGFSILMLTLPLLERYLRSKSNTGEAISLGPDFYNELIRVFPILNDEKTAKDFWHIYRHGILHQSTMSQLKNNGIKMPDGWLSGDVKNIEIDSTGAFWVNPVEFARQVISIINKDFQCFEALNSPNHPLPSGKSLADGRYGTSGC
jgi:hypothetical protein